MIEPEELRESLKTRMSKEQLGLLDSWDGKSFGSLAFVPETAFGIWFLGTQTWVTHVLARAIKDLNGLIADLRPSYPFIVDVGCGQGGAFKLLETNFRPRMIIGIDVETRILVKASRVARSQGTSVSLLRGSSSRLPLKARSVDMVFCHQTFHHLVDQEHAIREFHRILKPGGLLLFAESTRTFIHSWSVRYLFRHPMDVQKSAAEYLQLIRGAGFEVSADSVSCPHLWWSRSDLGLKETLFKVKPPPIRDEPLLNVVAIRT